VSESQRVTILDVAERAGVHPGTVSRALSRPEKVAPATRARVEAAAKDLGFVPNKAARGLITGRTGNVAVIVPDITNPFFASLVRSVEHAARDVDLQVLLVDTGENRAEEVRAADELSHDVDGMIVMAPRRLHREMEVLGATPTVFVNRPVQSRASVVLRSADAAGEALQHLAGFGHRHLAYLGGPRSSWAAVERRDAVRRMSRTTGVAVTDVDVAAPTFEAAYDAAEQAVSSGATAVMAFNDQMALGVLARLSALGVGVPEQISLVGCDDVPMAAMVAPALTTIAMPVVEAGEAAVHLLGSAETVQLSGALVIRASTGPADQTRTGGR